MTLVAAVVCPHPPLLIPEVGAALPVEARAHAVAATRHLTGHRPDLLIVVGDAPATRTYPAGSIGGFHGFGVELEVTLGAAPDPARPTPTPAPGPAPVEPVSLPPAAAGELPLSLAVGAWLLGRVGWDGPTLGVGVGADTSPERAAALGADLAGSADAVGLLVMGDASARRTEKAPGYLDPRAAGHDEAVAAALATGDPVALLRLDPETAVDLLAAGRASWQVLAGARMSDSRRDTHSPSWQCHLAYHGAPYGVGYLVAIWERERSASWSRPH